MLTKKSTLPQAQTEREPYFNTTRIVGVLFGVGLTWSLLSLTLPNSVWLALMVYAVVQLGLISARQVQHGAAFLPWLAVVADGVFAVFLLSLAATLGNGIYPLYLVIALRALAVYPSMPTATIVPFVLGPAYLFALSLGNQSTPLSANDLGTQWGLMIGSLAFGVVAIWTSSRQSHYRDRMAQDLREARIAADERVRQLERTAADLRARMRERHALEEGLKAITSSLTLDDVLSQIIDSTIQMLGTSRVSGIALSLEHNGEFEHRALTEEDHQDTAWADMLASRTMRQQVPLIVGNTTQDALLAETLPTGRYSALSVPLYVKDGELRGALSVISTSGVTFASSDARNMTAFAIQAGIAIGNAELLSQIRQQQRLLEAVLRDISDGLIVMNSQARVVVSNPLGRALLEAASTTIPVRDQIFSLAQSIIASDKAMLMSDIRVQQGDEGETLTFQAIGSLVRRNGEDEPLVAIVLHDMTDQQVEEERRAQFISMVAHELRNPLNSLNGFLKIVLQGRAGALSEMQQEFLGIADSQVELLKGRISELLEYNRVEAGRLNLMPDWANLSQLIADTTQRLSLSAANAGLELYDLSEIYVTEWMFDNERIGQVLTNLVENAIKATPTGGSISVKAELHDDEIWVRVADTGVGIPQEDQRKIFEPFVQGSTGTTRQNHLGLGLAICKQIIEGHQGRLWVESEPGRGTSFTFALPRVEREREFGR